MKNTKEFIEATLIRAARTFAQVSLGMITVGAAFSDIDWIKVVSIAGVSSVYSILTSIVGGLPETKFDKKGNLVIDDTSEDKKVVRFELDEEIDNLKTGDKFVLNVIEKKE